MGRFNLQSIQYCSVTAWAKYSGKRKGFPRALRSRSRRTRVPARYGSDLLVAVSSIFMVSSFDWFVEQFRG
jgi:hypothetical protein